MSSRELATRILPHWKPTDRLKQLYHHVSPPPPLDPLSSAEIEYAVDLVRKDHGQLGHNAVTLSEPKKKEMLAWLANTSLPRPRRMADVVAVDRNSAVYDSVVDPKEGKIVSWEKLAGVHPLVGPPPLCLTLRHSMTLTRSGQITMEDLQDTERESGQAVQGIRHR